MAVMAWLTCSSRRKLVAVMAMPITEAMPTMMSSDTSEATSKEREPAITSASSMTITMRQSVPRTSCARTSFARPSTTTFICAEPGPVEATESWEKSGAISVTCLNRSFVSACAMMRPLRSINMPKLPGVGWIDLMFSTTLSSAISPTRTALSAPSRITGRASATSRSLLVLTYGMATGLPAWTAPWYQGRLVGSYVGGMFGQSVNFADLSG